MAVRPTTERYTIWRCPECGDIAAGVRFHEGNAACVGFTAAHNFRQMERVEVVSRLVADALATALDELLDRGVVSDVERAARSALREYRGEN